MATVDISTTQNVDIHIESASVLHRAGAWLVDMFLLGTGFILVWVVLDFLDDSVFGSDAQQVFVLVFMVVFICYPFVTESLLNGQSLGKKLLGIRVVCLDGTRPTVGAYVIRWVLGLVELTIAFGSMAFLMILLSRKNQRLGDMVAGTTVVRVKRGVTLDDLALAVNGTGTDILYPETRYLTDEDVQVLRDVVRAQQTGMSVHRSTQILQQAVKGVEQKLGVTNNNEPEQFIRDVITSYGRVHGA